MSYDRTMIGTKRNDRIKTTAKNGLWVISGKIIAFLLSFALITALGNLVNKTVVGYYNFIVSALIIVSITTLPGMNNALVRAVSRGGDGSIWTIARRRVLTGLLGSGIAVLIGLWYLHIHNTTLGYAFLVAAPFVPLTDTLNEVAIYFFQGKRDYRKSAILTIAYQLLFCIPCIAVLFFVHTLPLIVGSFFLFQSIAGYIVYRQVKAGHSERDIESERFGVHLTIMQGFRTVSANIDRVLVGFFFGPAQLATYAFAATPISKLDQLIPIEQLSLPILSTTTITQEMKRKLLRRALLLFFAMIPLIGIFYLLAPALYHILFPQFLDSIPLFRLLLALELFSPVLLLRTSLLAWRQQRDLYVLETVTPLIKISLLIAAALWYGMLGVIVALLLAKCIESIFIIVRFQRATEPHFGSF